MKISSEFKELIKAWLAISIAFGILINLGSKEMSLGKSLLIAAITVGLGFVAHELSHRYYARKFGKHAEFKANNLMLIIAIFTSLFGFVLAVPGAVVISGFVNRREGGIIAAAGPAANIVLALIFLPFVFIFPSIAYYGFMINSWLALFNLIPFQSFDGRKVIEWNKLVYLILAIVTIGMNVLHIILPNFINI
jgi:Zn-dependent protease